MIEKAIVFLAALLVFGSTDSFAAAAAGEAFFKSAKCKNCHNITNKKKVGPGLAGISKRAPEEWLKAWLNDSKAVWTANEGYTKTLKKVMEKQSSPLSTCKFEKNLTEVEIADLIDYMKTLQPSLQLAPNLSGPAPVN